MHFALPDMFREYQENRYASLPARFAVSDLISSPLTISSDPPIFKAIQPTALFTYIPRIYIRASGTRCVARPRISLEETTPLHKQHNCGGVRASIAPTLLGVLKERAREKERQKRRERKRVAFITIVTKRLYSAGRKQRKRKFLRRLSPSVTLIPSSFIPIRMRARVCVLCITYVYDDLRFPRGAQI